MKKEKATSSTANPNKDDILIIPNKKEKKAFTVSAEFEKILKIKVLNNIKNAMNNIEKIIENKKHLLKFKIFHELKTKYFYFYQFTSKQKKRDNTNTKNVLAKFCEKCRYNLNEKDKKYLLLKYINNNDNKNFCASCNLNLNNLNSDESLDLNKVSIENFVLLNYEKKSLLSKIRNFFKSLLNNISNRQKVFLSKYFSRWNNLSKYGKYYSNIKNEYEKKYASKFEVKIQENNKILKKLDKEKVEITIKNESLLQIIQVNTLKINTFEEKEKNLDAKLKALTNEKKKVLSDLQKNEAHIDNKISNLENFVKELDIKVDKLTEDKLEKNIIISKYLDEMNHVLDYYEKKTSILEFY